MRILGISGSPRKDRMINNAIKEIVRDCNDEVDIISLSDKKINGCCGHALCAKDNTCKVVDDFIEIGEKMKQADIIIFGAPKYYNMINARAHATLERTFAFRHLGTYHLKDKLGIIVTTCETKKEENTVSNYIKGMFKSNLINTIGELEVTQYNQCYTCGVGEYCKEGAVVRKHGILKSIDKCHLPKEIVEQEDTLREIGNLRKLLKEYGVTFNS